LLQRGILLLSFRMVAGRRSGVHGDEQRMESATKCLKFLSELFRRKSYRRLGLLRWLVGDDEALVGALRRENASGANER
jgi:hypothetical protein